MSSAHHLLEEMQRGERPCLASKQHPGDSQSGFLQPPARLANLEAKLQLLLRVARRSETRSPATSLRPNTTICGCKSHLVQPLVCDCDTTALFVQLHCRSRKVPLASVAVPENSRRCRSLTVNWSMWCCRMMRRRSSLRSIRNNKWRLMAVTARVAGPEKALLSRHAWPRQYPSPPFGNGREHTKAAGKASTAHCNPAK